jgi:hypothetical protein
MVMFQKFSLHLYTKIKKRYDQLYAESEEKNRGEIEKRVGIPTLKKFS